MRVSTIHPTSVQKKEIGDKHNAKILISIQSCTARDCWVSPCHPFLWYTHSYNLHFTMRKLGPGKMEWEAEARHCPRSAWAFQGFPRHIELALDLDPEGMCERTLGAAGEHQQRLDQGNGITQAIVQSHQVHGSSLSSFIFPIPSSSTLIGQSSVIWIQIWQIKLQRIK